MVDVDGPVLVPGNNFFQTVISVRTKEKFVDTGRISARVIKLLRNQTGTSPSILKNIVVVADSRTGAFIEVEDNAFDFVLMAFR
uniref:THUMP domain-containing protein n=1 Tax=Angiostrongylus cantonensis TaxID=6313 RepID=A0A0K0CUB3_ANGCA